MQVTLFYNPILLAQEFLCSEYVKRTGRSIHQGIFGEALFKCHNVSYEFQEDYQVIEQNQIGFSNFDQQNQFSFRVIYGHIDIFNQMHLMSFEDNKKKGRWLECGDFWFYCGRVEFYNLEATCSKYLKSLFVCKSDRMFIPDWYLEYYNHRKANTAIAFIAMTAVIAYGFFFEPDILPMDTFKMYENFSQQTLVDQIWHMCNVQQYRNRCNV